MGGPSKIRLPSELDGRRISIYTMTQSNDQFAQWAAGFLSACAEDAADVARAGAPSSAAGGVQYAGLTQTAGDLLRAIDAGGVPAFVTTNLKQIAKDNGIEVSAQWTPNEVIDALRAKASDSLSGKANNDE